jgi:ribosomal protein S18 acetylase RimI-like enzyme
MAEIISMRPEQAAEARRVIYTTAHAVFHEPGTLEETFARYQKSWPIPDIEDFQRAYFEDGGVFLVTVEVGRIIGTGALKRLEEGVGEIKRVWLLPEYHGQGHGYRMMMALLEAARQRGYRMVRLQTSPAYQQQAFDFYKRLGFREIPRYGDDPDDVGMELEL